MKFSKHPLGPDHPDLPRLAIDSATTARLRASFETLSVRADEVATRFYTGFFDGCPELRTLFPENLALQKKKLTDMLRWVVDHLDQQDELRAKIREMGERHEHFEIEAVHYPIFCDLMVRAMRATAGPAWTTQLDDDWRTTLWRLSELMLGRA